MYLIFLIKKTRTYVQDSTCIVVPFCKGQFTQKVEKYPRVMPNLQEKSVFVFFHPKVYQYSSKYLILVFAETKSVIQAWNNMR